jgi:hypothetical protein
MIARLGLSSNLGRVFAFALTGKRLPQRARKISMTKAEYALMAMMAAILAAGAFVVWVL